MRLALLTLALCCAVAGATAGAAGDPEATAAKSTKSAMKNAKWAKSVKLSFSEGVMRWRSDGLPNHSVLPEYAIPNFGVIVPNESNSHVESSDEAIKAQDYDLRIPTSPEKADKKTKVKTGPIGVMISGAMVYNPYEGDGETVALASNFTIKNDEGEDVPFADACNAHPSPFKAYHYHGRPDCVTKQVDKKKGPSHIIGVAFDGFPIYGDRDINGKQVKGSQLDSCNGIKSPTPEFPKGIYHYVLLNVKTKQSSPACFRGKIRRDLLHEQRRLRMLCPLARRR